MMSEAQQRAEVVRIARSWIGTPYKACAMVRGRRGGGVDCAMILVAVFREAKMIPEDFDPRPYSPQWHIHRSEEKYMSFVKRFAHEVAEPLPGDVVIFRYGRESRPFAHGGIVTSWPDIVHARSGTPVNEDSVLRDMIGKHAIGLAPRKFYSLWGGEAS